MVSVMDKKIKKKEVFSDNKKKFGEKITNFCKINIFLCFLLIKRGIQ